jgi:hypothetical protein
MNRATATSGTRPLLVQLALPLLVAAACATSAPKQTPLMQEGAAVSAEALRIRMRALAPPLIAGVELSADEIRTSSTDPVIQRRAILWKLNTTSALYRQLFAEDPMAGLLDCWAMLIQGEQYLASPRAQAELGAAREPVLVQVKIMEQRVEGTFRWAAPARDPAEIRAGLTRWATRYPIEGSLSARRSIREDLADRTAGPELSAFASVGVAADELKGILARMDFLPTLVPKQSIWEAELAYEDFGDPKMTQLLNRADLTLGRVDSMLQWLGGPSLEGFADRQRSALLAAVDRERMALEALVNAENETVSGLVARERTLLLEQVQKERIAATADVRQAAAESIGKAQLAAQDVIDHLLLRLALLVAGAILLWGAVAAFLRRRAGARGARVDVGLPPP